MTPTVDATLLNTLKELGVLDAGQLDDVLLQLPPGTAGDGRELVDLLVRAERLTPFQAEQLLLGPQGKLTLGPYVLLQLLGEGGMGQVFKAQHRRLKRFAALKVIRPDCLARCPDAVLRFEREARAAASLNHPNIVVLYDFDQVSDTYFLAMEYVEGKDLGYLVKEHGPLSLPDACECIRQAALGLQHAHERGLVHRDIKPSNLLVTVARSARKSGVFNLSELGRTSAVLRGDDKPAALLPLPPGAVVKILDMGLARLEGAGDDKQLASLTQEGVFFGTPDFVAPEQARNARQADIRSDLYSLGCSFYYLLTGRGPFPEGNAIEKILRHQLDPPPPLAELRPEVPAAVTAVVNKLLEKRPEDRYQAPGELVEALAALQLPAGAPPAPPGTLLPVKAAAPATMVPAPTVSRSLAETPTPTASMAKKIASFPGHQGWVMAVHFTPDRNRLASAGMDGRVHLWGFSSTVSRQETVVVPDQAEVHALAVDPGQRCLAVGSGKLPGAVWLYDLAGHVAPRPRAVLTGHQAPVEALAFSPDGKWLASASCDKTVRLWDVSGPEPRPSTVFKGHTDHVKTVAFASDGKLLASAGQDGLVHLWSLGKLWNEKVVAIRGHKGPVHTLLFSPDNRTLASAGMDQTIRLWNLDGSRPDDQAVVVLRGHQGVVRGLQFTPDNKRLIAVDTDARVALWDTTAAFRLFEWQLAAGRLCCCHAFTYDGRYLATGRSDGSTDVYRLPFREMGL